MAFYIPKLCHELIDYAGFRFQTKLYIPWEFFEVLLSVDLEPMIKNAFRDPKKYSAEDTRPSNI